MCHVYEDIHCKLNIDGKPERRYRMVAHKNVITRLVRVIQILPPLKVVPVTNGMNLRILINLTLKLTGLRSTNNIKMCPPLCHCEERSDEAISSFCHRSTRMAAKPQPNPSFPRRRESRRIHDNDHSLRSGCRPQLCFGRNDGGA